LIEELTQLYNESSTGASDEENSATTTVEPEFEVSMGMDIEQDSPNDHAQQSVLSAVTGNAKPSEDPVLAHVVESATPTIPLPTSARKQWRDSTLATPVASPARNSITLQRLDLVD
jgi:hypothetical protein